MSQELLEIKNQIDELEYIYQKSISQLSMLLSQSELLITEIRYLSSQHKKIAELLSKLKSEYNNGEQNQHEKIEVKTKEKIEKVVIEPVVEPILDLEPFDTPITITKENPTSTDEIDDIFFCKTGELELDLTI